MDVRSTARLAALPTQFGKYLLDGEIATGGMSKVFRARLRGPGGFEKRLVVKQILPQLAQDPNFIRMFVQEANTLVQMSHPNIVPVYELGVVDGVYFLAMELVEGATLAEILRDGPLPEALVAHFGIQICEALHYAHDRFSVIHRDVTPRNVVVDDAGHARLLDFGIAAPADEAGRFGSVGYMSPEQARGLPLGRQSDLFSVATLLFEALSGQPAYLRDTPEATRRALLEDAPPVLEDKLASPTMQTWIARCLARDENDRPRSAADVAKGLRALLSASHPSGVAEELGRRAHQARMRAEAVEHADHVSTSDEIRATPHTRGQNRTLATSPILDQLLQQQTERIERVSPAPVEAVLEAVVEPVKTAPIHAVAVVTPLPPDAVPTSRVVSLWLAALLLLGLSAWAMWPLTAPTTTVPTLPTTTPATAATATTERVPERVPERVLERVVEQIANPSPTSATDNTQDNVAALVDAAVAANTPVADASAGHVAAVPSARAWLVVNALPWAEAKLDGRALGSTPLRRVATEAGKHTLELHCPPLGRSARVVLQPKHGETLRVLVDLNQEPPRISVK